MSRRFVTLLERSAEIRQLIEREESSAAPRSVRLMRLKKLQLQLSESLRELSVKQLIAMASAPSFRPKFVFSDVHSAPALSRGWISA
ncbi:MAG: hypothetical protein WC026_13735 [Hyphomicrobium sp.]|uniref:hypothetical protein n=1 Tax=Hyphomicrobium sp. TaxID=82 RepID=UPI003564D43B